MNTIIAWAKAAYANTTVYRLVWTGVTVGIAALAGVTFNSPQIALLVGLVVQILTSVAREHLAASQ